MLPLIKIKYNIFNTDTDPTNMEATKFRGNLYWPENACSYDLEDYENLICV